MDRVQKLLKSACADENFFKTQLKIDKSQKWQLYLKNDKISIQHADAKLVSISAWCLFTWCVPYSFCDSAFSPLGGSILRKVKQLYNIDQI